MKNWVSESLDEALELLERLVNINSFTGNSEGVNLVQDVLEREFSSTGLLAQRVPKTECGDQLVFRSVSSGSSDVLLMGHADTVHPPDCSFQRFSRDENNAYGPGICDMKGGIVVLLFALKALAYRGLLDDIPLTVLINTDEEWGSKYSRELISESAARARAGLVFEPGRENDGIITKRKGIGMYDAYIRGHAAHAGNAHKEGKSAVSILARLILALEKLTDYERQITSNVGVVSGGTAVNVIADSAKAMFEIRAPHAELFSEIEEKLREIEQASWLDGTELLISRKMYAPPLEETEESRKLFLSYAESAKKAGLSLNILPKIIGGGSDANNISSHGVPTIDALGPRGGLAHTDREFILLSSLGPRILSLAYWLSGPVEKWRFAPFFANKSLCR